jgi:site-specific recombinase XerD
MAKFNFYLRDKKKESDTPINLFISYNSTRLKYPTGKVIDPRFWNESAQEARQIRTFPQATDLNLSLKIVLVKAEKALTQLENEFGRPPHHKELIARIDLELGKEQSITAEGIDITFLGLFKRFIQDSETGLRLTDKGKRFEKRTIQKYNTAYSTLEDFGKTYHLTFESIDKNFYTKFVAYLNKKKYTLNTLGKYIQVLKTFLTYSTENGYNTNQYFKTKKFKVHQVPGFSIYLTEAEIQAMYEKDFSESPHLERVRDLFVVGCWTGLRFSDFTTIKPENIEGDFLRIKTFKTGEKVIIPIHQTVREIMNKYKDRYPNSLPPAISNQKMNAYLKDISEAVEVLKINVDAEYQKGGFKVTEAKKKHELVTTHTARRSFATNVYKSGFPAISLMKITGHKTEKAFLLYIKVTPEENAQKLLSHWNKSLLKVS